MLVIELLEKYKANYGTGRGKSKAGSWNWQVPSSGEVGGSRSGAETRLTGIRFRSSPGVGRCNVTSTDLPGSRREFSIGA
jgi:hypothetical protein